MPVEALCEVIAELAATEPSERSSPEALCALMQAKAQLEAVLASSAAAFEAEGEWKTSGAKAPSAWLAKKTHVPPKVASRTFRRGRALPHLPVAAAAFTRGELTGDHLDVLCAHRRPETAGAMARDEELLCSFASTLSFPDFCRALHKWDDLADPDGSGDRQSRQHAQRQVSLSESWGGLVYGQLTLDPISAAIVKNELERLERIEYRKDWATAKAVLGRDPLDHELERTRGQRTSDALVQMAARSRRAPKRGKRPLPLFTVLVDHPTLSGAVSELEDGTVVPPAAYLPWLTVAELERALFTPSGRVEIGERERFFTGATRRAIQVRDRRCTHPMCELPATVCEVDHIVPYSEGGLTTQANGRLLCPFHNRLRNRTKGPPRDGP